ncbi:hypothetical protein NXF25_015860 [Crotalus adamanteus]|uniref:Uncharacterized protein n=1 Tax=Crotalus adamanteus TaxID=8729 RepID=A0AAW1AUJ3_CROAD
MPSANTRILLQPMGILGTENGGRKGGTEKGRRKGGKEGGRKEGKEGKE